MDIRLHIMNGDSNEARAAFVMREYIKQTIPTGTSGTIDIIAGAFLPFAEVSDIDLLIVANLQNCHMPYKENLIEVKSFVTAIELKEQDYQNVFIRGENIWVIYPTTQSQKNATDQNFKQKNAVLNFCMKHNLHLFISHALWLKSIPLTDSNCEKWPINSPILFSSFSFTELIEQVIKSGQKVFNGVLDAVNKQRGNVEMLGQLINELTIPRPIAPQNTQHKIAQLISERFKDKVEGFVESDYFKCIDGKAGTGKTFLLLQTALRLCEEGFSCSLITYNNALVYDLKRLVSFIPSPPDIRSNLCLSTIHSYLHTVALKLGWKRDDIESKFLNYVNELWVQNNKNPLITDSRFDIDNYLLIDEAQDCTPVEKDIFEKIFGANRIIVANSALQKVRRANAARWGTPTEKLLEGLRQKSNIVEFLKTLATEMGISDTCAGKDAAQGLEGGSVIIQQGYTSDLHIALSKGCKAAGGCDYDILVLVPPSLTTDKKEFKYSNIWRKSGIKHIDGCQDTKALASHSNNELINSCRIFQYESCRGLEGWATVCLNLDEIIEHKYTQATPNVENTITDIQVLKCEMAYQWVMMPLTRAVDTLVITINDSSSAIAEILRRAALKHPDYVECKI